MSLQEIGLLVSGLGGIALGFSSQLGLAAAYGENWFGLKINGD
jgi:hypothetical protein